MCAKKYSFGLFLWCLGAVVPDAFADKLTVELPGIYDHYGVELQANQSALVIVYLKSEGDILEGFKVHILRESSNEVVQSQTSDSNGVVNFKGIGPGRYYVQVEVPENVRRVNTVALGDCRIYPNAAVQEGKNESE